MKRFFSATALFAPGILSRYLLRQFFATLFICLLAATSLFLVIDLFERLRVFVRDDATVWQAVSYMFLKIPGILQLMMPVAVLIATLLCIGRLSQNSEITAMRSCGLSIFALAKPILFAGLTVTAVMFVLGETIIPWASERVEEIYTLEIRKRHLQGHLDKANFWYREQNKFYDIGLYDSSKTELQDLSIFELTPEFRLHRRTDAQTASYNPDPFVGWTLLNVVEVGLPAASQEVTSGQKNGFTITSFPRLPLLIEKTPEDFRNIQRAPETMNYRQLSSYVEKLKSEGVPVSNYSVDLASKFSFPFINLIVIAIAFPFALIPARSGTLTVSFLAGVCIGFAHHILHAVFSALGSAELLPVLPAAWGANIVIGCLGGYLLTRAEFR